MNYTVCISILRLVRILILAMAVTIAVAIAAAIAMAMVNAMVNGHNTIDRSSGKLFCDTKQSTNHRVNTMDATWHPALE